MRSSFLLLIQCFAYHVSSLPLRQLASLTPEKISGRANLRSNTLGISMLNHYVEFHQSAQKCV